ncbi:MAG: 6,7-dimethyl-8-ribityllumazine synthase [Acidobacteria bacterium]|nr:6,7-dimethyl-8-ribityllumazine synthase [Acidobacteriota bacterium]
MTALFTTIEGDTAAEGLRVAVVASRFNDEIVSALLDGAADCLARHGAKTDDVTIYRVPGAFEIPQAVSRIGRKGELDAVVTLGALVRGETPHFELISAQVTDELSRVARELGIPVAFGVITCNTMEQAVARTQKGSNKGWEAALAAIEMANLYRRLA